MVAAGLTDWSCGEVIYTQTDTVAVTYSHEYMQYIVSLMSVGIVTVDHQL